MNTSRAPQLFYGHGLCERCLCESRELELSVLELMSKLCFIDVYYSLFTRTSVLLSYVFKCDLPSSNRGLVVHQRAFSSVVECLGIGACIAKKGSDSKL